MKKNLSWKKEENGNKMSISFENTHFVIKVENKNGLDHHIIRKSKDSNYILYEFANLLNCYDITFGNGKTGSYNDDILFLGHIEIFFNFLFHNPACFIEVFNDIKLTDDLVKKFKEQFYF